jgi:hypothetical protein
MLLPMLLLLLLLPGSRAAPELRRPGWRDRARPRRHPEHQAPQPARWQLTMTAMMQPMHPPPPQPLPAAAPSTWQSILAWAFCFAEIKARERLQASNNSNKKKAGSTPSVALEEVEPSLEDEIEIHIQWHIIPYSVLLSIHVVVGFF